MVLFFLISLSFMFVMDDALHHVACMLGVVRSSLIFVFRQHSNSLATKPREPPHKYQHSNTNTHTPTSNTNIQTPTQVLAMSLPRGAFVHLFAMASLELGSLFMCLAKILPPSPHIDIRLDRLYWVFMTLSNLMCLIGMFYGAYSIDFELRRGVQIGYKVFVGLITVILVYLRQKLP